MKKEEIEIVDNTIVLGIFNTETFQYFRFNTGVITWFNLHELLASVSTRINKHEDPVLNRIELACSVASKIIFILDDVHFPIDIDRSTTCGELSIVCENEELFKKTVFVKGDNVINFDKNIL